VSEWGVVGVVVGWRWWLLVWEGLLGVLLQLLASVMPFLGPPPHDLISHTDFTPPARYLRPGKAVVGPV
jgi:hypothetical protein